MAFDPLDFYETETIADNRPLRRHYLQKDVTNRALAALAGAPLLPANMPMAFNSVTGFWQPWDVDGAPGVADEIAAFLLREFQSSATGERVVELIRVGDFDVADINTAAMRAALPNSPSSAELIAALADRAVFALGLKILGVNQA